MLDTLASETPTRLPRYLSALLIAAFAIVPLTTAITLPAGTTSSPCAVIASDTRPRAAIRTRTHALNPRYMTRRLCARDAAGRIHCAR